MERHPFGEAGEFGIIVTGRAGRHRFVGVLCFIQKELDLEIRSEFESFEPTERFECEDQIDEQDVNDCSRWKRGSLVPITITRYSLGALNLKTLSPLRPWTVDVQVGEDGYKIMTACLSWWSMGNGAGHEIPKSKPKEALAIFEAFLSGKSP
ncbi:hypothetical protein QQ045_031316 [Rhodiola kirilowii]